LASNEITMCPPNFFYFLLDMFEERALILERLGRHDQVLLIYVTVLNDVKKAMEYCKHVYNKNDPEKREVFTVLMRMLLTPPVPGILPGMSVDAGARHVPDIDNVMKLLKDYAPYLEPIKV